MKITTLFSFFLALSSFAVFANDADNTHAFDSGADFAKHIKDSAGINDKTGKINPDVTNGLIPKNSDRTINDLKSYYGGVKGSSSKLDTDKQSVYANDENFKFINQADKQNPKTKINKDADFIKKSQQGEINADDIAGKQSGNCKTIDVTKSTFDYFKCDRQPYDEQVCTRTGTPSGHMEVHETVNEFKIDSTSLNDIFIPEKWDTICTGGKNEHCRKYLVSEAKHYAIYNGVPHGMVSELVFNYTFDKSGWVSNLNYINVSLLGKKFNMYDSSGTIHSIINYDMKGGALRFDFNDKNGKGAEYFHARKSKRQHFFVSLMFKTKTSIFVPEVKWNTSCPNSNTGKIISSQCVEPGSDKPFIIAGKTYMVHSDCWHYQDDTLVENKDTGSCQIYDKNPNCTVSAHSCDEKQGNNCTREKVTYQCETKHTSKGKICGGTYFCQSGDCQGTDKPEDSGFNQAVSQLAGVAAAGEDMKGDSMDVKAFTGKSVYCRKAAAGFSNCCKDSGWGKNTGLAHCSSEEKAIGKAKEKKIIIRIGTFCSKKVLGVCLQKKESYCQFGGKLAKIIQQQGREGQLHIGFGSAKDPDCRGITIDELQKINFDNLDFSDFYSDLQDNKKIPADSSMADDIKKKIHDHFINK